MYTENAWKMIVAKLINNGFDVRCEYDMDNDCTNIRVLKKIADYKGSSVFKRYDRGCEEDGQLMSWASSVITAHRIIGVEEVR